jgi:rhodanese-related sulfurtransferase
VRQLSAQQAALELREDPAPLLLDVREAWEREIACVEPSLWIPMGDIPSRIDELDPAQPVICLCHHGVRSLQVALYLRAQGFADLANLAGGIDAWACEIDASMRRY